MLKNGGNKQIKNIKMISQKIPLIKSDIAELKEFPSDKCTTISELLFGEHFKILEDQVSWIKVKNLSDNYVGWLDKKNIFLVKILT